MIISVQSDNFPFLHNCKYFFVNFSLPWNCGDPFGYIGEILFHIITGQLYIFCTGIVLLLFIAMCLHHQAFYQMYCHSLHKLECIKNKQNYRKNLCELIQFHVSVKKCVAIKDVLQQYYQFFFRHFFFLFKQLDVNLGRSIHLFYTDSIDFTYNLHRLHTFHV